MSGGGWPRNPCLVCGLPIPVGRNLCVTGGCSKPLDGPWEPKTEWGRRRKADREAAVLRVAGSDLRERTP